MAEKKKKILLVDDEIDFIEMFKLRLESVGYQVVSSTNGKDAIEKASVEKPDAILLDILMPGIDGLEVLRQIRIKDEKVPIFIVTAFSNEARFNAASKYNATGFIVKTADLKKEIDSITNAIYIAEKYKTK
ncbi:MAG: response regulator [Candidatus Omnitrophota bacterium]